MRESKYLKMQLAERDDNVLVEDNINKNLEVLEEKAKESDEKGKDLFEMIQGNSGIKFDKNLIFLNDEGEKKKGNVYLDRLQNGLFECIQTTSTKVNNSLCFKNFSNNELSNRIDNLCKDCQNLYYKNINALPSDCVVAFGYWGIDLPKNIPSGIGQYGMLLHLNLSYRTPQFAFSDNGMWYRFKNGDNWIQWIKI